MIPIVVTINSIIATAIMKSGRIIASISRYFSINLRMSSPLGLCKSTHKKRGDKGFLPHPLFQRLYIPQSFNTRRDVVVMEDTLMPRPCIEHGQSKECNGNHDNTSMFGTSA